MRLVPIQRAGILEAGLGALPVSASGVLEATSALYDSVGFEPPWICYIAVASERVVGTCGFKSAPIHRRVEIAYFTFQEFEGKGVATQMARQLIAIARDAAPGVVVVAQTLPARNASHRVLEKLGFGCMGVVTHPEDGEVLEWHLVET